MKPEVKALWLQALRSGEYEQGLQRLRSEVGTHVSYCCMGVLCDLYRRGHQEARWDGGTFHPAPGSFERYALPIQVFDWAGLSDADPGVDGKKLSYHNDGAAAIPPKSFAEIADLIETHL